MLEFNQLHAINTSNTNNLTYIKLNVNAISLNKNYFLLLLPNILKIYKNKLMKSKYNWNAP